MIGNYIASKRQEHRPSMCKRKLKFLLRSMIAVVGAESEKGDEPDEEEKKNEDS